VPHSELIISDQRMSKYDMHNGISSNIDKEINSPGAYYEPVDGNKRLSK
jgi:hypothetical protein